MYRIVRKRVLNPTVIAMDIDAPLVAAKAQAGQFIILRVDAEGERIPLTVAGYDRAAGTVRIIFQTVGATTDALGRLNVGDSIQDFVGPLGKPTELEGLHRVCVVGGGFLRYSVHVACDGLGGIAGREAGRLCTARHGRADFRDPRD